MHSIKQLTRLVILSGLLIASDTVLPPLLAASPVQGQTSLQYTLERLAETTTPDQPLRILFYGQSISRGAWPAQVIQQIQARYPEKTLIVNNLAISGFAAQKLILNAHRDLLSFYPDLIIFHVYGNHFQYEHLIIKMRTLTTADIAIQTHHLHANHVVHGLDLGWTRFINHWFLPRIAERYQTELIPIRQAWRTFLSTHRYQPAHLLIDKVHLNPQGHALMADIVGQHLLRPAIAYNPFPDRVQTYAASDLTPVAPGVFELTFTGNRLEAVIAPNTAPTAVLIDGKPPSAHHALYVFSRANAEQAHNWPWDVAVPFYVHWQQPPLAETWTLTVQTVQPAATPAEIQFSFSAHGTQTGFDGIGSNQTPFVSNSGRIVIPSDAWLLTERSAELLQPGYQIQFEARLLGQDQYHTMTATAPQTVTLAQGLANETHTVRLVTHPDAPPPITAVRVYRPPLTYDTVTRPLVSVQLAAFKSLLELPF